MIEPIAPPSKPSNDTETKTTVRLPPSNATTNFGGVHARPFQAWPSNRSLPCVPAETNWSTVKVQISPTQEGFLFVKPYKVGGSTAAGVNIRLARNVAQRQWTNGTVSLPSGTTTEICKNRYDHAQVRTQQYHIRNRMKSFLWSIIRDPTKRAISSFFHFEVSRNKVEPTDWNFQAYLRTDTSLHHHYLRTLSLKDYKNLDKDDFDVVPAVNGVLAAYDFIAVTERMDESIVVLQLLLGLTTGDVLFFNAKNNGGFDDGSEKYGCVYIVPSFVSPGMKKYFETNPLWKRQSQADRLLYEAVNRSLDLTIEQTIGLERFESALQRFRHAQRVVHERCAPKVVPPCSAGGEKMKQTSCFFSDFGCGTDCIDQVVEELHLYN